jgi:hypothetical protein
MLSGGASGGAAAERRCRFEGRGRGSSVRPCEVVDEEDAWRACWEDICDVRLRMRTKERWDPREKITRQLRMESSPSK